MTTHQITNKRTQTVDANIAGDTWIVTETGKIQTGDTGIYAGENKQGREIVVEGLVFGTDYGIVFGALNGGGAGRIVIAKGGDVNSGDTSIMSRGDGQEIVSNGNMYATDTVVSIGDDLDFVNNGRIDGLNTSVRFEDGGGRVVNNGKMIGESAIYATGGTHDGRIVVINNGLMDTDKGAIELLTDAGHLIRNTGTITSDIYGGGGRDRFVNDGGKVLGEVDLGDGNDSYVVDRSDITTRETSNHGKDTVRASADFTLGDYIEKLILTGHADIDGTGNSWNNRISGNSGNNRIDGGGGDDVLKGGGGRDVFLFSYHGLSDEIADFKSGTDRIDMRGWDGYGLENFADVKTHATNQGHDLLITLGGSDDLLIHDLQKADLDKHDFIF
jgi:Ca2+-binding RTX toxin-like protein